MNSGEEMDFDEWLNEYPCKHCGGHYNDHVYLLEREIEEALSLDYIVMICETPQELGAGAFTRIFRPPENPCDEEHMREIST